MRSERSQGEQPGIDRLFEMTSELLATISKDGRFALLNPAWEHLLGWTREELLAEPIERFMHPDDVQETLALLSTGFEQGPRAAHTFTNRYRHRDGSWRWLLWSARRDADVWYTAAKDVTDRKWLENQALHDPLTGLPNRLLLMDRARHAISRLHRSDGVVAIMFLDLDRFKAVNDSLGHDAGDQLLIEIAGRLSRMMRDSDTVARLGGDEFVVLLDQIESEQEAISFGERVLDAMAAPFQLGSAEVSILASAGVTATRSPDVDPEALLREADVAMYRAKGERGRRIAVFDDGLRQEVSTRVEIVGRLREALPQQELLLAYQPIIPLAGGAAVGAEALVRWQPRGGDGSASGEVLPSVFLPRAEESELIVHIGKWVLHTACRQAEEWRRAGVAIPVSVNVSARELTEMDLAERVREELAYCRLPGKALCIEVSEEIIRRDPDRAREALKDIKRLGVSIALDRFGSGEYAIGLPTDIPFDTLKVDRVLIGAFDRDRDRRAVFAATIALAKEAGLTAIAVGIETNRQLALARELDCAVGQGFFLHGPTAANRLTLKDAPGPLTSAPWRPIVRLTGVDGRR